MIRKYTVLTLSLLLVVGKASSMNRLVRFSSVVIGAAVAVKSVACEGKVYGDTETINISRMRARQLLNSKTLWCKSDNWKDAIKQDGAVAHTRINVRSDKYFLRDENGEIDPTRPCGDDTGSNFLGKPYDGVINFTITRKGDVIQVETIGNGSYSANRRADFGSNVDQDKLLNEGQFSDMAYFCPVHGGITCCWRPILQQDKYTKCEYRFKYDEKNTFGFKRDFTVKCTHEFPEEFLFPFHKAN